MRKLFLVLGLAAAAILAAALSADRAEAMQACELSCEGGGGGGTGGSVTCTTTVSRDCYYCRDMTRWGGIIGIIYPPGYEGLWVYHTVCSDGSHTDAWYGKACGDC